MINRVRIVGAVPRLVPLHANSGEWRLDTEALTAAVTDRTRAIFVANPGMPTGNHLNDEEWNAIASMCRERAVWLIYLAWMERILFDGRPYRHPASLPDMADRVIHVGCVTFEQRMIGWRIGWVVSPAEVAATPMTTWGERVSPRFIRFVYSNEAVERLSAFGERLRAALNRVSD